MLGFVYPGKGHEDVLDLAARLPGRPRVVAAGSAGAGHDDLAAALRRRAVADGFDLVITGWLSDAELAAAAHAVTVPIVPGRQVSASGSLATWWGAGRRPLTARGEYTDELARRHPGALHLYDDAALDAAAGAALDDGSRTRLGRAEWPDAGAAHAALYRRVLRGGRPGAGRC